MNERRYRFLRLSVLIVILAAVGPEAARPAWSDCTSLNIGYQDCTECEYTGQDPHPWKMEFIKCVSHWPFPGYSWATQILVDTTTEEECEVARDFCIEEWQGWPEAP